MSSGAFSNLKNISKSEGPMGVMASFMGVPYYSNGEMRQPQPMMAPQAQPQNQMSREQIHAMLMQHPAFANFMQQHRPGFMANMVGQPGAPAPAMPGQMTSQVVPPMPQPAAPSMAGIAQPGLMQMLMSKFGGQPRVQGLLG